MECIRRVTVVAYCLSWLASSIALPANSNCGREFYLGMIPNEYLSQNVHSHTDIIINVASVSNGNAEIEVPFLNTYQSQTIQTGSNTINISRALIDQQTFIQNRGIHLKFDIDVSVIVSSFRVNSPGSYLALPLHMLGKEYVIGSYKPANAYTYSHAMIISTTDNTVVTVKDTFGIIVNVVTLNRLDVYQIASLEEQTGMQVTANQQVSLISGAFTVIGTGSTDLIIEQMIPTNIWTNIFVVPPVPTTNRAFVLRALTKTDTSVCYRNSTMPKALCVEVSPSKPLDLFFTNDPVSVSSNNSISLLQYGVGDTGLHTLGDPSMVVLPGLNNFLNEFHFDIPYDNTYYRFVVLIVPTSHSDGLLFDGAYIRPTGRTLSLSSNECTKFTIINHMVMTSGYHTIRHKDPTVLFGALIYGMHFNAEYAYPAGFAAGNVDLLSQLCGLGPPKTTMYVSSLMPTTSATSTKTSTSTASTAVATKPTPSKATRSTTSATTPTTSVTTRSTTSARTTLTSVTTSSAATQTTSVSTRTATPATRVSKLITTPESSSFKPTSDTTSLITSKITTPLSTYSSTLKTTILKTTRDTTVSITSSLRPTTVISIPLSSSQTPTTASTSTTLSPTTSTRSTTSIASTLVNIHVNGPLYTSVTVRLGDTLSLPCAIVGVSSTYITWTRSTGCYGQNLQVQSKGSATIVVQAVNVHDSGSYVCMTTDRQGTVIRQQFNVTVTAPENVCNFDNGKLCGWMQMGDDDAEWNFQNGPTISGDTGPDNDHTLGNANGQYLYIESSSPMVIGDKARLALPGLTSGVSRCFCFWYYMYGDGIGNLKVYIEANCFSSTRVIFHESGDKGKQWYNACIDIPAAFESSTYQIVIEGDVGPTYHGDIAIDDVDLKNTACSIGSSNSVVVGRRDRDNHLL